MMGVGIIEIMIVLAAATQMGVIPAGRRWLPWVLPCLVVATILSPGGDPNSMIMVAVPLVCVVVLCVLYRQRIRQSH